jgi:hypothetical protein
VRPDGGLFLTPEAQYLKHIITLALGYEIQGES